MSEIWKKIECSTCHEVSNLGRIRKITTKRLLHPGLNTYGYPHFSYNNNGKMKDMTVHKAVAIAFIPNPEHKPQINHKNGVKTDNNVNNLEWCSCSENIQHAYNIGLKKGPKIKVVKCVETGRIYDSMQEASRKTKMYEGSISQSIRKGYSCYGTHWELANKGENYE